jgi:hypothetical protein
MPVTLPTDGAGQAQCQLFETLAAGDTCAAHPGLVAASTDAAAVRPLGAGASQSVCVLAQLPQSSWVNGSCETSSQAGWCYLTAPAAPNNCAQAIVVSATGMLPANAIAALGCP